MSNSLKAGEYNVGVGKTITASRQDRQHPLPVEDKVEAVPARWSLSAADDGSANALSVFPAPGQIAPSFATLPHIVLRDAQLPWARRATNDDADPGVPWLALIVFTREELELEPKEQSSFFAHVKAKINDTFGWDLSVGNLGSINDTALANLIPNHDSDKDVGTKTSVITIPTDLFEGLFTTKLDSEGQKVFDVSPFRFMSHVRKDGESDLATSVVISHRLGPDDIEKPTPIFVHLVSLQGINGRSVSSLDAKERVIMTSLYSWSYNAIPPNAVHLGTSLTKLDLSMLGYGHRNINKGDSTAVFERLNEGYTLVRHRTQTGEVTAAMYRGPLVPRRVPYPLNKDNAKFGGDLRIYDPDLNLSDISYVSAWQLGKSLAMQDGKFTTALWKLRGRAQTQGLEKTSYGSRREVIAGLSGLMDDLRGPTSLRPVTVEKTDSVIVQEWVFNRLLLHGISAHYLIADQSHLPSESLRFFYVDKNWTEALVDGALSLANHFSSQSDHDVLRAEIKEALSKRQVPSYGFLLRSEMLVQFPQLAVSMERGSILVQRKLAEDIMLVLLDSQPRGSVSLTFTPVGQPTFTAAAEFLPVDGNRAIPEVEIVNRTNGNRVRYARDELFDWKTRTLKIEKYVAQVLSEGLENEIKPTAAGLTLQLEKQRYAVTVDIEDLERKTFQEKDFSTKGFTFSKDEIFSLAEEPCFRRSA